MLSTRWKLFLDLSLLHRIRQIISQMRWLVVGCILPTDTQSIDIVVHQCGNGIFCRDICGKNIQMGPPVLKINNDMKSEVKYPLIFFVFFQKNT